MAGKRCSGGSYALCFPLQGKMERAALGSVEGWRERTASPGGWEWRRRLSRRKLGPTGPGWVVARWAGSRCPKSLGFEGPWLCFISKESLRWSPLPPWSQGPHAGRPPTSQCVAHAFPNPPQGTHSHKENHHTAHRAPLWTRVTGYFSCEIWTMALCWLNNNNPMIILTKAPKYLIRQHSFFI